MTGIEEFINLFLTSPLQAIGAIIFGPVTILIYIAAVLITPFYQALIP